MPSDELTPDRGCPIPGCSAVASIAVYICTHQRNQPLVRALDSLADAARRVQPRVEVGVVVVDDNPDGRARPVVDRFDSGSFALGLHYRHSGARNISVARNLGLETAAGLAQWVAMTDDDQVVAEDWLAALIEVQERTGADAVTGPVFLRYAPGAASWLTDQPFAEILEAPHRPDGALVGECSTGNSMLRSSFLTDHPDLRFSPDLGVVGGEDMVFYRAAVAAGLEARYAAGAVCVGEQPAERETYRYQLRGSYWLGNTEYITNRRDGSAGRIRLMARGLKRLAVAPVRPWRRLVQGHRPQWRFAGALAAQALGLLAGVAGRRVPHP